jgi:hypothetical protein
LRLVKRNIDGEQEEEEEEEDDGENEANNLWSIRLLGDGDDSVHLAVLGVQYSEGLDKKRNEMR